MKKIYRTCIILCLLTFFEAKPVCDQGFLSNLYAAMRNEIVRTLYEPGFPAAVATFAAGLTSFIAYYKMSHAHPKSAAYKNYETIRSGSITCMGPLLLLTALMVSEEEQQAGTIGARTIGLWCGIPITVGSLIFWLQKLYAKFKTRPLQDKMRDAHTLHASNFQHMALLPDNHVDTNL